MKRVVVLGMGRSGTSFLSRFLAECGVYVDEVSDKYEHAGARRINDSILEELFGARPGLPYGKLPPDEIEVSENWHARAMEFIEYMDKRAGESGSLPYWAFKDPRTTVLHKLWIHHFDIVIGIFRSPEQVVESYVARRLVGGWRKRRKALDYWLRFNQSLLEVWKSVRGVKPMYMVDYNGDIPAQTSRLCAKLGIQVTDRARAVFSKAENHFSSVSPIGDEAVAQRYQALLGTRNLL